MRWMIAALSIGLGLTPAAAARDAGDWHGPPAQPGGHVEIEVEYPPEGAVVNGSACGVFVAGRALAVPGESPLDVVIVLDTSLSTIDASGADVNGNGVVGRPLVGRVGPVFDERSSDPGDSVLAAEVAAARLLLRGLDPRRTRLALVTFAGEAAGVRGRGTAAQRPEPATTVEPLALDHARIDVALSEVLDREPSGSTHMAAGVDRATRELVGPPGASPADPGSGKVVVFFTDGQPTLPYGPASERENVLAVFHAADRAARAGVRIDSFAIGPDALEGPVAVVELAARTGGSFTPVPNPGDLVELMRDVRFTSLREVTLRNATTGAEARPFRLAADGSWIGFLEMDPGANHVEIVARAAEGTDASRTLEVHLDPDKAAPALLPMFVVQRNELLEVCLEDQRRLRMALENKRLELVGKELQLEIEQARVARELRLEIERARARARERAAAQRKELKLAIDEENPS
jgi:hypothetical protein